MSKFSQRIEVVTNVLIIVVALLLIGVMFQRYFLSAPDSAIQPPRIAPTAGKKINLPNEDWAAQRKTIVLALQTTCHYCTVSAPFYKRLIEDTKNKNIRIVAVFPQPVEESTAHLTSLGLTGLEVRQAPISDLDASGTPTLIIANDKGEVIDYWVGKLPADKEQEVITKINS